MVLDSIKVRDHRNIDARSLAFGKLVAAKLMADPSLVEVARQNLANWMRTCSERARPALEEWLSAVDGSVEGVIALLTGTDERATRLRQSNPFAGVLTQEERTRIIRQFDHHEQKTA